MGSQQGVGRQRGAAEDLSKLVQKAQSPSTLDMEKINVPGYEEVIRVQDKKSKLHAIIAIHDTTLGPALGGIRIQPYATFEKALEDVLRLSKGMTYKSAITEVGFGGGKIAVIADPKTEKTPEMMLSLGAAIERLGGRYICAEDVGCSTEDCKIVRRATKYVVGLPQKKSSGDPGPFTAWGIFRGIQSAVKYLFGSDSLEGRTVAVQGLGNVGSQLVGYLFWAGANLILSDVDAARLEMIARKYDAKTVPADQILSTECDVLSPCALGAIINDETIPRLRCKAIAGCSNNQLLRDVHADDCKKRGILYAPDFVINAGGLLNVAAELEETGYHPSLPRAKIHRIYDELLAIYELAQRNNQSTHTAAIALANYRIQYGIGKRFSAPTFHHIIE